MSSTMKHELLVPVGNFASLVAAINNGADAVYLGGKKFGARAFAENFTLEKIEEATKLCHLYGVKIYITVNTLLYDSEINEALEYVRSLHQIGVDALIMQDVGFIDLVHKTFPNLEIHASTQMHNHSSESIHFLESLGIKRIVFARELPLSYINDIETSLEKEVFIHGSLCISYSGQCLFSARILKRSGNRGECAGMCRLPYKLIENDKIINTLGDYLLSPKDLETFTYFEKLMKSNIKCFKIEGRMKSPLYVSLVTKLYRTLIDNYENGLPLEVDEELLFNLKAVYNRGYTEGYLNNKSDIINVISPNHKGISIGKVIEVTKEKIKIKLQHELKQFSGIRFKESNIGLNINFMYDKNNNLINKGNKNDIIYLDNFVNLKSLDEVMLTSPVIPIPDIVIKKIDVSMNFTAKMGEVITLTVSDSENEVTVKSTDKVASSKTSPITKERIKTSLEKTGNTPFNIGNLNILIEPNLFIPISILNNLRRDALDKLKNIRENKKVLFIEKEFKEENENAKVTNELSILARTKEQIKALMDAGIKNIIVLNKELWQEGFIYRVPRSNSNHYYNYDKLIVTDYASMDKYPNNFGDYNLNITNHYTFNYLSKYLSKLCLSVECDLDNIKDIMANLKNKNVEVLIYGNIELMLMKYCPINYLLNKDKICHVCKSNHKYYLQDRNNSLYRLISNSDSHTTVIYDTKKIDLINKIDYLKSIGVTNFRIDLLEEDYNETKKLIERVKNI